MNVLSCIWAVEAFKQASIRIVRYHIGCVLRHLIAAGNYTPTRTVNVKSQTKQGK